jgi:2-oxoglutarate ferredoxin oxidoreductase subunit alpha
VVYINVQRGGPSTGIPTQPAQGDMMQARFGSHGDFRLIALCPNSPQECFDLTLRAFNLAEEYRVPVMVMLDEVVGHMTEKVVIPPADQIQVTPRRYTSKKPGEFKLFEPAAGSLVPEMVKAGDGYRIHVTGLTHDERGYPAMNVVAQDKMEAPVRKIVEAPTYRRFEEKNPGAEAVVVSHHVPDRQKGCARAREGRLAPLITAWPFPEKQIVDLEEGEAVPELNMGQMVLELERLAAGRCRTVPVLHAGGTVHNPEVIAEAILEAVR